MSPRESSVISPLVLTERRTSLDQGSSFWAGVGCSGSIEDDVVLVGVLLLSADVCEALDDLGRAMVGNEFRHAECVFEFDITLRNALVILELVFLSKIISNSLFKSYL